MIQLFWLHNQQIKQGGEELISQWQALGGQLWVDIGEEKDTEEERILARLGCHALAIGDVQRQNHPPKLEHFEQHSFMLYRHIRGSYDDLDAGMQNVGLFFNENLLVCVHDFPFVPVERIAQMANFAALLQSPVELLCALVRSTANEQLDVLADFEERISTIEDSMARHGTDSLLEEVLGYRGLLRRLKRIFDYHEKIFAELLREPKFWPEKNKNAQHSLRDIYDKFDRLQSLVNLYYDLCGDLSQAYLSVSTHQLNRTMQVLTVITAIFIPLTFVVGVYGMNFDFMPELRWRYGYFGVLFFMLALALGLLWYFKYKKWL